MNGFYYIWEMKVGIKERDDPKVVEEMNELV